MSKRVIVKVQSSVSSNVNSPDVLIYAKGQKGVWQGQSKEVWNLLGAPLTKRYFYATLIGTKWRLEEAAPEQDW